MRRLLAKNVLLGLCAAGFAFAAHGQNRGPGTPPGQRVPGGSGGPGGPPPAASSTTLPPSGGGASSAPSSQGASRAGLPYGPPGRWWDDKRISGSIGLRKEQQTKMDGIFNANKPAILETYQKLENEKAKLDQISKQQKIDQDSLFAQIDAVSQARSALQKATSQMLLQIRQEMNAEQITKLESTK